MQAIFFLKINVDTYDKPSYMYLKNKAVDQHKVLFRQVLHRPPYLAAMFI